jgi:predicted dehydrogenase
MRKMRIFQPGSYINVDFGNKKVMIIELSDELQESGMPKQNVEVKTFSGGDALRSEIEAFILHVTERSKPAVSGVEGRRALDVALQVIEQIKEHQQLPLFKELIQP